MSKTKAGGCGGLDVDMHLRTERATPRLTNRTFVSGGMAEIINVEPDPFEYSSPALDSPPPPSPNTTQ